MLHRGRLENNEAYTEVLDHCKYGFNMMDIIIGSVMLLAGLGAFYMIAGGFSVAELFQRAGPFALIPLVFIAVAIFLFRRGLFTKQVQE